MQNAKALVLGATGYVGSAVARALLRRGCVVSGTARTPEAAAKLRATAVLPVDALLHAGADIDSIVRPFDIIIYAAMIPFDEEGPLMDRLLSAAQGDGRIFVQTSGTGVLSIPTREGLWDEHSFTEDEPFPFTPTPASIIRLETEANVRGASSSGFRTMVVRPPLIWGNAGSIQIPRIFESARAAGAACYLGKGLNLYSNVHVDDLAEVYALAVERGQPGALYHAVAGEANFRTLARAVAKVIGCEARSVHYDEACALWGAGWTDLAMAVNSRSRAVRTREELGWSPVYLDVVEDIEVGSYAQAYHKRRGFAAGAYAYSGAHGSAA